MMKHTFLNRCIAMALAVVMLVPMLTACGSGGNSSSSGSGTPSGSGSGGDEDSAETIKIAAFINATGASAADGEYGRRALDIAVEWINEQHGGIDSMGGRKLELKYYDMMSDNTMVRTVVEQGLSDPEIAFAVGSMGSGYTMAAIPAIARAGVPMMTTAMSDNLDEENCEYLWLISPTSSSVSVMTLDYIKSLRDKYGVDITKIGIAYCDTEYGVNTTASFQGLIESDPELGYVTIQSYPPTITDMSPVVTALQAAGAEIVYAVPDNQDAKLLMQSLNALDNYDPILIGGGVGMVSPPFGEELGDDVQGIMTTGVGSYCQKNLVEDADLRWCVDTYHERWGGFPGEVMSTMMTYVMIIEQVLEHTGTTDRETNQQAMAEMEFEAANPTTNNIVKFNENRRNENALNIMMQWQWVEEFEANIPVCVYPEEFAYSELQFGGNN